MTYGIQVDLVVWECPTCGIVYGIPVKFANACKRTGASYYCPTGHKLSWYETDADRERKKREKAERELSAANDTAERWKRNARRSDMSARAYKGHLTRIRKRIVNGVCPVPDCKRSGFTQVMRHIKSQHPDWLHDHPELSDE
jgi:hypothetical protein